MNQVPFFSTWIFLLFVSASFAEPYFDIPSDQELDPAVIPPALEKQIVARVGKGGVTQFDWDRSTLEVLSAKNSEDTLMGASMGNLDKASKADRQKALQNAIDEELLFQAAIEDGVFDPPEMKSRVRSEYSESLASLPELPKQRNGGIQFQSIRLPDLAEFTEERIQKYYEEHSDQFKAPAQMRIKYMNWPTETDEGGMARKRMEEARGNPSAITDWQGEETITEGQIPHCITDGGVQSENLASLYQTPQGSVTPVIYSAVNMWIFWVVEKGASAGPRPLNEARPLVLYQLAKERYIALHSVEQSDPDRFYRMAIQAGAHRHLRQDIGFRYWSGKGLDRGKTLAELRTKYPSEVLVKEFLEPAPTPEETLKVSLTPEGKTPQGIANPTTKPPQPVVEAQVPPSTWNTWKSRLTWIIIPIIAIAGLVALIRYLTS